MDATFIFSATLILCGISIPTSYASYLAPVTAARLHSTIASLIPFGHEELSTRAGFESRTLAETQSTQRKTTAGIVVAVLMNVPAGSALAMTVFPLRALRLCEIYKRSSSRQRR
jgi:hypothetical protein